MWQSGALSTCHHIRVVEFAISFGAATLRDTTSEGRLAHGPSEPWPQCLRLVGGCTAQCGLKLYNSVSRGPAGPDQIGEYGFSWNLTESIRLRLGCTRFVYPRACPSCALGNALGSYSSRTLMHARGPLEHTWCHFKRNFSHLEHAPLCVICYSYIRLRSATIFHLSTKTSFPYFRIA